MKNITLSAQDDTIAGLRAVAAQKNTTVNELFRAWANELTVREQKAKRAELHDALVRSFQTVRFTSERKYTRDEINAR
jgi:hypothetical protein